MQTWLGRHFGVFFGFLLVVLLCKLTTHFLSPGVTPEMEILMQRRIYPFLLMVVSLIGILSFQIRQFKRLYEHIKNDKYVLTFQLADRLHRILNCY